MTTLPTSLLAVTTATTTSSSKSSGSSSFTFIFLIAIVAGFYFLIIRPRQTRQRQAKTQAAQLEIGASVMSVGGIRGTVVGIDDTDVQVEVAPGVVLTFVRRAVNAQAPPASTSSVEDPVDDEDLPAGGYGHDEPDDRPGTGTEGH